MTKPTLEQVLRMKPKPILCCTPQQAERIPTSSTVKIPVLPEHFKFLTKTFMEAIRRDFKRPLTEQEGEVWVDGILLSIQHQDIRYIVRACAKIYNPRYDFEKIK